MCLCPQNPGSNSVLQCFFFCHKGNHANVVYKSTLYCVRVEFCYLFVITVIVFVIALTTLHLITKDTSFIISMVLFVLTCQCNKGRVQLCNIIRNFFLVFYL